MNQLAKKWKEEESEGVAGIDEEMEQNAENESEEDDNKTRKQVNGSKTQTEAEKLKVFSYRYFIGIFALANCYSL